MDRPIPSAERNTTVLLIEDDVDVLDVMVDAIQGTGRQVFTARDGTEALALLDSPSVPRPCVILLDWLMRPMNGEQFLARLSARPDAEHLSVVVMSGSRPAAGAPMVRGFLPKPFEFDALVQILDRHC